MNLDNVSFYGSVVVLNRNIDIGAYELSICEIDIAEETTLITELKGVIILLSESLLT
jgi:hypothetical protein